GRKRVRLLEHHADAPPHLDGIDTRAVNVLPLLQHRADDARAGNHLVHAVQATDERRLATPRWADDSGDRARRHGKVDVTQHVPRAEPGIELRDGDPVGHRHLTAPTRPRVASRAIRLTTSTSTIRTSAPAHAWRCQ